MAIVRERLDDSPAWQDGICWSNDGVRLHYRDYPAAPANAALAPILCLPGLTRNARDFEGVTARLAGQRRILALDFRGRGESGYAKDALSYTPLTYVQDVEAILTQQKIDRFVAFGTSLGGIVTMLLAATRRGRIVGALLNDIGPTLERTGLDRIRAAVGQGRSHETWVHAARALQEASGALYPDWALADWIIFAKRTHKLTSGGKIVLDYDGRIAEPFRLPGGDTGVDLWPTLAALADVPTLILRGELSDLLSDATAQRMVAELPKAELVTVPHVGHAPTLDEPASVAAIDALMARIAH